MKRMLTTLWLLAATSAFADAQTAGRVLLGKLDCIACHQANETQIKWLSPKVAPRLADIGSRTSAEWLEHYLGSPNQTMPGTTMPDLLGALPAGEREAAADSLTHYLLSREPYGFKRTFSDKAAVARGKDLYCRIGCAACHAPQDGSAPQSAAVPLPNMAEKWSFGGLQRFLLDPLAVRPSGRMPTVPMTSGEAADVAHYMLRDTRVPAALEESGYQGQMRSLDDIDSAELRRTRPADGFTIDSSASERRAALRFAGWLQVDNAGEYTFYLSAVGAARLSLDDKWVIEGEESWDRERIDAKTTIHLHAGLHAIRVDYVHRGQKPPALKVEWEGPALLREIIPVSKLRSEQRQEPSPEPFVIDDAKAAAGKALYAKLNCAACHEGRSSARLPSLASLDAARGCLADKVPGNAPNYHLDPFQLKQLRSAIAELNQNDLATPSGKDRLADTLATFNCTACHTRDGHGGVTPDRDRFFTSNGTDLGDEGRLPPRLDGVGDKLQPAWLDAVLTQAGDVRPYLDTRMPQFGKENVGFLPDLFVAIDRTPQTIPPAADDRDAQREAGRKLVGTDGLSCIVCHKFDTQPAQTMQVIDLITAPKRLNEDWFRRFLLDPNRFHPATRMPAFWPNGRSPLPALLGGSTDRQHAAIWSYLSDGARAKFPTGIGRQNVELVAGGEAIVYRGKLWEAGFRAVAIAYPQQVNAAFDADDVRLSLLWPGRFLNVGPHWNVQGMGSIHPLGKQVAVFPHGPEFASLADPKAPWPKAGGAATGMRFRGYQLDSLKRPTLLYSVDDIAAEDFMTGTGDASAAHIKRTLNLTGAPTTALYFRAGGGKLVPASGNAWRMNDVLTITIDGAENAILRGSGDAQELLLPVVFHDNHAQIEVEYGW